MSKVQRRFLRREGRRLWATTNVQGKKGMMKLLPVKEKQIHEVLVTLYMDKGELNSEQWKRAGLGTAGHDQFLFISCRQTQYRPKSKNIWVFPNSYILTLGKHKRNVVIGKMWTKNYERQWEFFKKLLDDQAAHDQWKNTAVPQSLPQFTDVLNAWNFRSFIQEIRHQT